MAVALGEGRLRNPAISRRLLRDANLHLAGTDLALRSAMSDEQILHRKTRLWLYMIALLHLVCLGLLHRAPAPEATHAGSRYAQAAVSSALPRT